MNELFHDRILVLMFFYYDSIRPLKEVRPPPFFVWAWEKKKKNDLNEGSTSRCKDTTLKYKMKAHTF